MVKVQHNSGGVLGSVKAVVLVRVCFYKEYVPLDNGLLGKNLPFSLCQSVYQRLVQIRNTVVCNLCYY